MYVCIYLYIYVAIRRSRVRHVRARTHSARGNDRPLPDKGYPHTMGNDRQCYNLRAHTEYGEAEGEPREACVTKKERSIICNVAKQLQILLNSYICINRECKAQCWL